MNWKQFLLIDQGNQDGNSFKALVDRNIRDRRRDERRFAEHRKIKYQFQARNSCVADARNYRVASQGFKRWLTAA